ncbi:MAG: ISAzo13 family transposase [Acidobacteriota bacterium]|nr:ISAzo13 family transposase [Acidobacteriota bacterium]
MDKQTQLEQIRTRYRLVADTLDERGRRAVGAAEAITAGWGGITLVARATGLSRTTLRAGISEHKGTRPLPAPQRVRRPGGGRKPRSTTDPLLLTDLEALVEPTTRGDPESPLRWTCLSLRKLATALQARGHIVSYQWVGEALHTLGYSLQANAKTSEGASHPDRDAQFAHINATTTAYLAAGDPVISVDTKKKELVGDFKQNGREWRPVGEAQAVQVHDFPLAGLGRVSPYGIYDLAANTGWVSVGVDHDTAGFAVATIREWWHTRGRERYPHAQRLLISADGGGSNGSHLRLWKWELQGFADETGLSFRVCHLPPGTSKWNKIEHRLFAFISQNWRGRPLVSYEVILSLIAATTTATGLTVESYLDTNSYPMGRKVTDAEMSTLNIERECFHGEWNYSISPRSKQSV